MPGKEEQLMNALAAFAGGRQMICVRSGGLGNPRADHIPHKGDTPDNK